jgi:hypothetical protein
MMRRRRLRFRELVAHRRTMAALRRVHREVRHA